jgi:hypothetical protein
MWWGLLLSEGARFGETIMRTIVFCTAMLVVFAFSAEAASLRDRCAASTGAKSGTAFDACVNAGKAQSGNSQKKGYVSTANRMGCKMQGNCQR